MTRDHDTPGNSSEGSRRIDASAAGNDLRQEPRFSHFEDLHEDGYEEPDRDTNFASGYRADSVEEDEAFDDSDSDAEEREAGYDEDSDANYAAGEDRAEESDDWLAPEGDLEDPEDDRQGWPLGLIVVAIVAVVLLAAGGYGVLQQRAAQQEEIRELRAALAVAANPRDVGASRGALDTLQQSYDKLSAQAEALSLENRRLADTVAGLEAQLGAQQSVPARPGTTATATPDTHADAVTARNADAADSPKTSSKAAAPRETAPQAAATPATTARPVASPAPTPQSSVPQSAAPASAAERVATAPSGPWFVNFGTYATRNMADTWATRLHPSAGEVIIAPNDKDGKTLYRVRVVGLADRDSAQQVARQLEADLRVPQLWVGRE